MNRINVNQIKQVGAFTFLYFLAIGLGVLVGNLVDHQGNDGHCCYTDQIWKPFT